jgi:hypothetical protein
MKRSQNQRPPGKQVMIDRTTRDRALPLFSASAVVVAAYLPTSRGGDGELPTPVPLKGYAWPSEVEAIVVVEPDHACALRLGGLGERLREEQDKAAGKPPPDLGRPFAVVAGNCREIGMGIEGGDFDGTGANGSLLARTERRIDVHAWEEILFRHFEESNARGARGENTDGWSDAAYAEVFAKYGGRWLPNPKPVHFDIAARRVLPGTAEA